MTTVFAFLVHVVLFCAAIGQLILIAMLILDGFASKGAEGLMRSIAGSAGLLLYLGARALGVSIPELSFKAMSTAFPVSIWLGGVLLPAMIGFIVSWFVVHHISGRNAAKDAVAMRVLTMVMSLVFFLYCDSYLHTFAERGASTLHYLPNLVFVLCAALYAVFRYQPYQTTSVQ